jgi:WD40 repeat protein
MAMNAEALDKVGPKPRVFISYSRKDMLFADRLEAALKARGFEPLIDRAEIYAFEDWWKRIQALISGADTVVFVLSPDAVASDVALKEVMHAASLNKRFAPIVCRRVEDSAVPETLRRLNFVFFDDPERFEASADRLAEALNTDIGWIRRHTEYGESSRHWSAAGRPGGLLLRSPALEEAEHWIASRPHSAPVPTDETRIFITESRRGATRRRNTLTGSLAAGLIGALALAGLAYWQRGVAIEQERLANERGQIAQSRELASGAERALDGDTQLSLHLAVRSALRSQTMEAKIALRRALAAADPGVRHPIGQIGGPTDRLVSLSGTAEYGVTLAADGHLAVWQLRPELHQVLRDARLVGAPLFSQDEKLIATRASDGILSIWSIDDARLIARFESVQTASFLFRGLTYMKSDGSGRRLIRWDPATRRDIDVRRVNAPRSIQSAAFFPGDWTVPIITINGRTVEIWPLEADHALSLSGDRPYARYTDPDGIDGAWFSNGPASVVITNAKGSKLLNTLNLGLVSTFALRSLRTVAFRKEGGFMVAVPAEGESALVDMDTGEILAKFEKGGDIAAAAFDSDGQSIVFASPDGSIWRQSCVACAGFERVLDTAKRALRRPLTLGERELYLHERRPALCRGPPCIEFSPNSGPPGSVVEVTIFVPGEVVGDELGGDQAKIMLLTLTDASGKTRPLPSIKPSRDSYFGGLLGGDKWVGTLTIPAEAGFGPATIEAVPGVAAGRFGVLSRQGVKGSFPVICMWCDP